MKKVDVDMFAMDIDYDEIRAADSPNGLIELLSALGHEPETDWDGMSDLCELLLDNKQPAGVRKAISDEAITIRNATSLVGEKRDWMLHGNTQVIWNWAGNM